MLIIQELIKIIYIFQFYSIAAILEQHKKFESSTNVIIKFKLIINGRRITQTWENKQWSETIKRI